MFSRIKELNTPTSIQITIDTASKIPLNIKINEQHLREQQFLAILDKIEQNNALQSLDTNCVNLKFVSFAEHCFLQPPAQ